MTSCGSIEGQPRDTNHVHPNRSHANPASLKFLRDGEVLGSGNCEYRPR